MEKSWATQEISQVQVVYPKCRCIRPALKVISRIGEILGDTGEFSSSSRLSEVSLYSLGAIVISTDTKSWATPEAESHFD